MGNLLSGEPPPPVVLVPPLFDFPPLAARTRILEPSYHLLFGKLALRCLFEDYFGQANHFSSRIMFKPIDDPHVDIVATLSGPLDTGGTECIEGDASFRWQRDLDDPHTFMDVYVSNSDKILRLRSCAYYPDYGMAAFGIFPLFVRNRKCLDDYCNFGLRYVSQNLSIGTTFMPFHLASKLPANAWLVGQMGRLTAGIHFKHVVGTFNDLKNWSWAVSYGLGSISPLTPSFTFSVELARSSRLIASFYEHHVVQRRVKNPYEESDVVGITNYVDFGFELETRIERDGSSGTIEKSKFQAAASWQANKNFMVKGKVGPLSSSVALAFKSWWNPSFLFSMSAFREHGIGKTSFGFGIQIEDLRRASYQRADPNYVMLTPTKQHMAEGIMKTIGKRPILQSDVDSANFEDIPKDLKPIGEI